MYGDDLTNLFTPPTSPASEILQAKVISWNQSDGSNSVQIGAATLFNLPFLDTGVQVNFDPNQAVMVLRRDASYFILGAVESVGANAPYGSSSLAFVNNADAFQGFAMATTDVEMVFRTVTIPTWATFFQATCIGHLTADNTTASQDFLRAHIQISATVTGGIVGGPELFCSARSGDYVQVSVSGVGAVIGFSQGGGTVRFSLYGHSQNAAWTTQAANTAALTSSVIFGIAT